MAASDVITSVVESNGSFWDFKGSLDTIDKLPLMSTPFPMVIITASYILFVLKIGPNFMKTRKPYNLHNIIVLYNILQVLISVYIFYLTSKITWSHGWISKTCLLEREDTRDALTKIMYYYFLAKVSEVLDTIFFVLRKKYSQVTFLHVYHHTIMIVTAWGILKYEPTYPTVFIRYINSFVHVVMYSYYALSSYPSLTKYLWWKKYITSLQLIQFALILIHFTLTYITSECTPSYPLCITVFWNTSVISGLFLKFYIETYTKWGTKGGKPYQKKEKTEARTDVEPSHKKDNLNAMTSNKNNVIHRRNIMNGF